MGQQTTENPMMTTAHRGRTTTRKRRGRMADGWQTRTVDNKEAPAPSVASDGMAMTG